MKLLLKRYSVILALLLFWGPQQGYAQSTPVVQRIEIKHVGPPSVSDELIRANIRVKIGDALNKNGVNDDVRNLYGTGFFYNIRVAEERVQEGVKLIYVVQGKPTLTDIQFTGNKKYSDKKLLKKASSKIGEPLDERKLFADAQAMQELYRKAGYQKTSVKYLPPSVVESTGRGTVTFEVTEAPKVKIQRVDFVGAEVFSQKKLRKVIKTRKRWAFSWLTGSGILKEDKFEEDKDKLAEFYNENGYIDFQIRDITYEYPEEKWMVIKIHVFEGSKYEVGNVAVKGNQIVPTEQIEHGINVATGETIGGLGLKSGDTFTPKGLQDDTQAIQDVYGTQGYIDARVNARKTPNIQTGNMDLNYEVDEGEQAFIEKVEIRGNTKTKDKVIRRELAVSPGEVFDMVRVRVSRQKLEGMNYFEKVDANPEPTDVPNRRNLVINVEEKNTGNISAGAGFSTIDNLVGFVEVTQGNFDIFNPPYFTGGGQKARARATVGGSRQDYQLTFIEPWLFDRMLELDVNLYHRQTSFQSSLYDEQQTGGSFGFRKGLGLPGLSGRIGYTLEDVGIEDVDRTVASPELIAEEGTQLVSKVGLNVVLDRRGPGLVPTSGYRGEFVSELAGGPFGGEADFYRLELRGSKYFPGILEDHYIEILGRIGTIQGYSGHSVRLFNRYFMGGPRTLRGYRFARVAPRDSLGEPFGGNTYWFGSVEYTVPIIERLSLAAFYDIGNVYSSSFSFNPNTGKGEQMIQDDIGIGIRLNIPQLGPLRLDYGFPLQHDRNNTGGGRFNFDVGFTRDF